MKSVPFIEKSLKNVQIILLKPEEWRLYRKIRLKALKEEPQAFSSTYEEQIKRPDTYWKQRLQDVAEKNTQWLLFAKFAEQVVGMVGAFAEKEPDNAHVVAVYVIPEARGKGISKKLMKNLLEKIKDNKNVKKITVDVNPEQIPAYNLYKNFGFKIIKKYQMVLGEGKKHDVYQLQMLID